MSYRSLLLALFALLFIGERATPIASSPSPLRALRFEPSANGGFVGRSSNGRIELDANGPRLDVGGAVLSLQVANGRSVTPIATEPLATKVNYLVGDRSQWRTNLPTFAKVTYPSVLDGVDLVFHGEDGQLEYDLVVAPGTDPSRIALRVDAEHVSLTDAGDLRIAPGVVQKRPRVYQGEHEIASSYRLRGDELAFDIGAYDHDQPLVIDPVVEYSATLDRQPVSNGSYSFITLTVAPGGYAYAAGNVSDAVPNGAHTLYPPGPAPITRHMDVIVAKIDPQGNVVYVTVYGGNDETETPLGMTTDDNGRVYIAGYSRSTDLPMTDNAFQKTPSFDPHTLGDGILFTLNADGSDLVYATYLDLGTNVDFVHTFDCPDGTCAQKFIYSTELRGITNVDGRLFVTGNLRGGSGPWIVVPGPSANTEPVDASLPGAFIAEVTAPEDGVTRGAVLKKKFLGGSGTSLGNAIAASENHLFVGGKACNPLAEGITPTSFQPTRWGAAGNCDGFVAMYGHDLGSALWGSYAGGQGNSDTINGLAVGPNEVVYAVGTVNGQYQVTIGTWGVAPPTDALLLKLAPAAGANGLVWSQLYSGNDADTGLSVSVDADGRPWITGTTRSTDFPTIPLNPNTTGLQSQAYVMELSTDGLRRIYGAHYGLTADEDIGGAIQVTSAGVFFTYTDGSVGTGHLVRLTEPPLSLFPTFANVHPGETVAFNAAGGTGSGYEWTFDSKTSGSPTLNPVAGFYTAGENPGVDVIRVTDLEGHTLTSTVHVVAWPPDASSSGGPTPPAPLVVTPTFATVSPKGTLAIQTSGGEPPYQYTLISNGSFGSVNPSGLYVAGTRGSVTDRVHVTDAAGQTADVTINVSPGVTITPTNASVAQNAHLQLTATGGKGAPYTWTASAGSITSAGDFTAPLEHVVVTITASDGLGNTASVPVAIGQAVGIAPLDPQTFPRGNVQLSAFGGTGNYTFTLTTSPPAGGEIAPQTGVFTAGPVGNTKETVLVKDTANRVAGTTITIGPGVTIAPIETRVESGAHLSLAAAGGSGVGYTFSLESNASGSTIDPATGAYTAGPNAGLDVVRLVDSVGNDARASITVTAKPATPPPPTTSGSSSSSSSGTPVTTVPPATNVGGGDDGCNTSGSTKAPIEVLFALAALAIARARRSRSRAE